MLRYVNILVFAAVASAAAAETTLVYANYLNPKHPTNAALTAFFDRVEEQTDGSVVWESHFASSLLGPKDTPAGVRDGIADAGYFVGVYVPSEMPIDNYVGDFSMINDDAIAMTGALNELILVECEECGNEYREAFNTEFLGTYALTDYLLQCKEEYHSLSELKGKKIRGFSGWSELIRAMDAVPVSISADEMYEALERGILDCAIHSITNQRTRSLGEVAHNVILDSLGGFMGGSAINLRTDKWNALTPEERKVILENLPQMVTEALFAYVNLDKEVREEMEAKGNKFYYADEDLANFITTFRSDYVANETQKKGRERGVQNPGKIADQVNALYAKWNGLLEEHGREAETFQQLLWDEVYSKVPVE